jgi:hypothetical protein
MYTLSPSRRTRAYAAAVALILCLAVRAVADIAPPPAPAGTPDPKWSAIKADTYDQRVHFAEGAKSLLARLDGEIARLNAKRAGMTTDTKDWDFVMKEVNNSRSLLQGRISDLGKATTPETWADAKDKVGDAWHLSRLAIDKMNSTVTS